MSPEDSSAVAERREPGGGATPRVLIEVPHGATSRAEFDAIRGRLRGTLPAELESFFHVNTDEGAPELAFAVAARLAARGIPALVLRCRIPRTFVDVNRVVEGEVAGGMTAGIPTYVTDAADRRLLLDLHARYTAEAEAAYAAVLGHQGALALQVHTYAPRAVGVEVDDEIVPALRRAYRPKVYSNWTERPPVDLITATAEGEVLASPALVSAVRMRMGEIGVEVTENASYHLHPATTGARHARKWPGRVLCLEVRRDLLGTPWRPFVESKIGPRKAAPFARALARAIEDTLTPERQRRP